MIAFHIACWLYGRRGRKSQVKCLAICASVGNTIDFYLSPTRNTSAARRFLAKALAGLKEWEKPKIINTDKAPTYAAALAELKKDGKCPEDTLHRQVKYLTDIFDKAFFAGPWYFYLARANRVAKSGYWDVSLPRAYDERVPFAAPVRLGGVVCQLATKRV